jgi:iron(II)-dependent oxidoreductase
VTVAPFRIARAPVTQAEFAEFVEAGGYRRPELRCEAGREWLAKVEAEFPLYWSPRSGGGFWRRDFNRLVALEEHRPVLHVNWFEADAYCRFAGRRLPTEAEWEFAAACGHAPRGKDTLLPKRRFPWGDDPPSPERAHLDARFLGCAEVGAYPVGDSVFGCRQMIGNVWEWTASDFLPYPGFSADPYREYSEPWFGNHKVLRGGCFATRGRLLRNAWRNFYTPDRRDVWCGFRTAALR